MPHYLELSDLTGEIPPDYLTQALDDNADGEIDAWSEVQAKTCEEIDSILERRFPVPLTLTPLPRIFRQAAIAIACYRCYRRRQVPDEANPFTETAKAMRKTLNAIADGTIKLSVSPNADAAVPDPAASIIIMASGLGNPGSRLLA